MGYHFNRLMNKTMPLSTGSDLYDISYTYGYKNDGRNGAGRITQIDQGQGFKVDLLKYDELGQVVEEATTIQVPMHGPRSFTTSKSYDSFGRIIQANYPDGDRVNYSYTSLGELYSIGSTVIGTTQMIVSGILYNGYGQISRLNYGNGTYTDYDYEVTGTGASLLKRNTLFQTTTTAKEQGASTQSTVLERNYTYNTQGMVAQLDRDVAGTLMNSSLGSIVSLSDQYNYDAFGRFDNHTHKIAGSTEYNLEMSYNKAGGIIQKDALATGITNFQGLNYTLDYSYVAGKPHQLQSVFDQKSGITSDYIYNSSGSIKEIIDPGAGGPQQFYWNEEQWLSGVSNDLGVHHYVYDYKGERIMKSSVMQSAVQVNDQNIDDVQYLDPYTLYINPYYVVTELQGGDKVSKHYYMNTQRVATDISINYQGPTPLAGPLQQNASDPKKPSADTASVNYNAAFADLQQTLEQFGKSKLDVDHLGTQPTLEAYYPELAKSKSSNVNGTESTTRVMFWYHPDYLGNVDLVTERDGKTYEFFTYNPWGEEMHQYNANTFGFASPYRFNSKEKDQETGLHYYGARYYSSKLSVWMSVDPLAHKTLQPYIFTSNNTLLFIDPDGRENIVIIGNQGSRPNSDANSGSDKKHFLEAGLKEAFELNKQNEQNTTILITKGDYTEEQLFSITERANVYGINVLIIEGGAGDVIDYINNGANQNRNQDLITDLVYVGHSTDDNLYIGQGVGLDRALSSDRITREIKSEAFYTESTVKLNSCRAGNCSIVPNSIATAFASKVSKVFATPNYVNWSLPVGTYDTNLPNNQWQTTEGTGGVVGSVLKQKVELKSKSIKL